MTYNTECGICKTPLTRENTKPGFGVCDWIVVGEDDELAPTMLPVIRRPKPGRGGEPQVRIKHKLVCLECAPRAEESNQRGNVFVYDADGITFAQLLYRAFGYDAPQIEVGG